ncbi:MAG: ribosome small subunit-dependent GTPase A [Chloroflexi bacterium]|nr:ribosome small subunit-dependent GTPase A [Chloroflexota bacterium]
MEYHAIDSNDVGVVYHKSNGMYRVCARTQTLICTLAASLAGEGAPAVGDRVRFATGDPAGGRILDVLPRRSCLARRAAGRGMAGQVLVANLDQVVPVFAAAAPPPHWNLLDRYLVSAEASELPAVVCITKLDLAGPDDLWQESLAEYRRIGYRVILTSAVSGQGLDELKEALQGRLSALIGKSGVGKTRLLNALQPGLGQRVGALSRANGKGRHTTTAAELFPLADGGALVDTPGMREFGLWDVDTNDLALYFPEMRPLAGRCRFGLSCRHDEEPGCAIRKAVMDGQISPRRYRSYLRLAEENGGRP